MFEETRGNLSLTWTQKAEGEWKEILTFYTVRNGSRTYSLKLDEELQKKLTTICSHPELGEKTKRKGIRRCVVARRFAVFYQFDSECVEIITIVDARRNVSLD